MQLEIDDEIVDKIVIQELKSAYISEKESEFEDGESATDPEFLNALYLVLDHCMTPDQKKVFDKEFK